MHCEDGAVDDGGEREVVEYLTAVSLDCRAPVFAHAFVVESVHLGYLPRFVISANVRNSVVVSDFESEKEEEGLDGIEASVDEVA